jgi:hypothetical protein
MDGEILTGETDSVLTLEGPGIYSVLVADFEGCPGVLSNEWLVVDVNENEEALGLDWNLFPNPVEMLLQLRMPNVVSDNSSGWNLNIFDDSGKIIRTIPIQSKQTSLDVTFLSSGIYTVQLMPQNPEDFERLPVVKRLIKR